MAFPHLDERILKAVRNRGYKEPTPIQAQAIPPILQGKDILGIAQTGTGKTAAFVLPMLQLLDGKRAKPRAPRALILAPTRELAGQIAESCDAYGEFLSLKHAVIYGGVGQNPQVQALARGVDILIATPGRLMDLLEQRQLTLGSVEIFVLDEADRMLDMGFIRDIRKILPLIPAKRQSLLFSATMPPAVAKLAHGILKNPVTAEVTPESTTVERIEQKVIFVDQDRKDDLLRELLEQAHLEKVLVFTRTKHRADKVVRKLMHKGIKASAIHGNKSQNQRSQAMDAFQKGRSRVLVATDIAARGIDIKDISHVINYDLPDDVENYVHRIGRTARAGTDGTAYSFSSPDDRDLLRSIERNIREKIPIMPHTLGPRSARSDEPFEPAERRRPSQGRRGPPRRSGGGKKRSFPRRR